MIRDAVDADIPAIVEMSRVFWQETTYKSEEFQEDAVIAMTVQSMDHGLCLVFDVDGVAQGFVCGVKGPLLANFDAVAGTELAWWVNEGYRSGGGGIKLLYEIEKKAKKAGIKYWNMAYMESSMPSSIKKIYESMGYKMNECLYQKVL
jgi:GNAT superfamily N-acetyltransferase